MSDDKVGSKKFWIGTYNDQWTKLTFETIQQMKEAAKDLLVDPQVFFRHAGIFGSTGSGKTVLGKIICEEAARHGIPVIAIDPQGDIASLALPGNKAELEAEHGVPSAVVESFMGLVDIRIFTPASGKGLPISLNPVKIPEKDPDLDDEDIIKLLDNQAKLLVSILKKAANLSSSFVAPAEAGLYSVLERYFKDGKQIPSLSELARIVESGTSTGIEEFLNDKQRQKLAIAIKTLGKGSAQLLFSANDNLNIDALLQRRNKGGVATTPVNVFFLKALYTQEEKEFFLSVLVNELYSWMIRQGHAKEPRCIFFCDEIAPFMPAGAAKPGPKDALILLFRQARKYGVQCFIATQSPKDVDYHAYEQFNSFFIGRITSQQSMKVVERLLEGFSDPAGRIKGSIGAIPVLKTGQFLLVSPDNDVSLAMVYTRWLLTVHKTITLDDVKKIMAGKLDVLIDKPAMPPVVVSVETPAGPEPAITPGEKEPEPEPSPIAVPIVDPLALDRARQVLESLSTQQVSEIIEAKVDCIGADIPSYFTNRLVMQEIFNRLGTIAKKDFGLEFLLDLAEKGSLPLERAQEMYLDETNTLIKAKLATPRGDRLEFTFSPMLASVLDKLKLGKDERAGINEARLQAIFMRLIASPDLKRRLKL
ncbi:MAG: ATP-binding protein [Candidatus Sigynarchaeum springense]